jgi:hypothetical protein
MKNLAMVSVILVSIAIPFSACETNNKGLGGGSALGGVGSGGTGTGGAADQGSGGVSGARGSGGAPGMDGAVATGGTADAGSGGSSTNTVPTGGGGAGGGVVGSGGASTPDGAAGSGGRNDSGGRESGGSSIARGGSGGAGRGGAGGARTGGVDGTGTAGAGGGTASGGVIGSGGVSGTGGTLTNPCLIILTLDRSCTTTEDCFSAATIADCCGSGRVVGLRKSEQAKYADLEQQCEATWPACACPTGPTILDDGSTTMPGMSVGVTCQDGVCTTFVPACEGPCASGTTCFSCQVPGGQFAACTTPCKDVDGGTDCPNPDLPRCQHGTSGNTYGTYCTSATAACDGR